MKNKLIILEELQELDLKSDGSQTRIQQAQSEITAIDGRLQEAQDAVDAKAADIESTESEKCTLEENLAIENGNIARSEANLKGITNQKEYQAVNKEISTAKKLISELEEQILLKSARMDELGEELNSMKTDFESLEQNLKDQKDEVAARIAAEESAVAADATLREEQVKAIPAGMLKRYEKLRESRRGIAIVEARDGSCLGCNMQIPPQMYNNLFRGEELITCPHCQRMLFLKQPQ